MSAAVETSRIAAQVPKTLADDLERLATKAERSVAAEVRLALKAYVTEQESKA